MIKGAQKISRHFFYFNDYHLFDNAIFPSDILLYVAYGDVCKKANITFVGKCFIVQITIWLTFNVIKAILSIRLFPEYIVKYLI